MVVSLLSLAVLLMRKLQKGYWVLVYSSNCNGGLIIFIGSVFGEKMQINRFPTYIACNCENCGIHVDLVNLPAHKRFIKKIAGLFRLFGLVRFGV
jgi:hypothetical protein